MLTYLIYRNTSIVVCFVIHVALISIVNGEIEICVKLFPEYGSQNPGKINFKYKLNLYYDLFLYK